ncbi:RcnB family protein [Sphingomonas bacterium]|uniref:RcnB family protein n=1 Tax=Sphingomonas bacterium TaxID=1895847 RepID=UPI0015765620|nr:RcnB family protein [Sphingomonas bacterium]
MVKPVIGLLLAAAAFAPAIAGAQQANVEARGDVQVDGQRGDQARRDAYRAQHQQQQPRPQAQGQQPQQGRQPQGQPQQGQPQQNQYRQGQNGQAQYRQGQYQQGQYRQGQYQQGQYQQGQRPNGGPDGQRGYTGRGDQGRPNFGPNAPGGQGGYAGRGNDGRGYQDGRGAQSRGGWNNGWHGDRRYDWNGYRAQNRGAFHLPRYYAPGGGYGYRRYSVGITLGYGFYGQNYWIGNPYTYRLPPAYGPYRWVRYYNDALLVDVRSGYVVDAAYGIFW